MRKHQHLLIALLLGGLTLGLYWPVHGFDLIYYDDPVWLKDYAEVAAGLTWAGIRWAFTTVVIANWHPMTNLSFLAVSQFFGNTPGAQHLANAVIHAANATLLFLLMRRLTGATWRSAVVAALFAWHPLRVESVAWIAERKDVLCAFFFLLALLAYARFAQTAGGNTSSLESPARGRKSYWTALICFALALLSKPMAVTLPFVLLLLDVWPLGRVTGGRWQVAWMKGLVREKIPFFALMLGFCGATYWTQHDYAAMTSFDVLSLDRRVANAIAGYVAYPTQLFWPVNLAVIYPFPETYDVRETVLKAALLAAISFGCLMQLKRRPQLAVGWCWFLGMAVPVIGMVQVGEQSMADRYTYLPLIGPVIALVWTAAEPALRSRRWQIILSTATLVILATLVALTTRQLQFWRNTIALFEHNVRVTPNNGAALFTLGLGYEHAGELEQAIICYRMAQAVAPADPQPSHNLATLLAKNGQLTAAEDECAKLLARHPDDFAAHVCLSTVYAGEGRTEEEAAQLNEALQLNPDSVETLNNLAWLLATSPRAEFRDGPRAVQLAQRACELTQFHKTIFIGTLAAAYAEAGKYEDAIATAQRACELAAKNGETELQRRNGELQALYRNHQAYHEK